MENNLLDIIKTVRDLKEAKLNAVQIKDLIKYSIEEKKNELIGATGAKGEKGDKGEGIQGPRGLPGPKGNTGTGIEKISIEENDFQVALAIHTTDGKVKKTPNIRGPRGQRGKEGLKGAQGLVGPSGPPGDPGVNGESFRFVGGFIPGRTYAKGDIVSSKNGSLYLSLKDNNNALLDVKSAWELVLPYPVNYRSGTATGTSKSAVIIWEPARFFLQDSFIYMPDNKIYRALTTHTSTANFYTDYRNGLWANMSDGTATEPLLNGAVNVRLLSIAFIPAEYRMVFVDLVTMRKSSTVADTYYKVTLTFIWNGTAWVKNESSKTYFPGTPDDITFSVATVGANSALEVYYTSPTLAGVYDAAFSKIFLSIKGII